MSSSSLRIKLLLDIKKIKYLQEEITADVIKKPNYLAINPSGKVPSLKFNNKYYSQTLAIMLMIEEKFPKPALLPKTNHLRTKVIESLMIIISDIQPLQNLSVVKNLNHNYKLSKKLSYLFAKQYIEKGLKSFSKTIKEYAGKYCFGNKLTLTDICFYPQYHNAIHRFGVSKTKFPLLMKIFNNLSKLDSFKFSFTN